MKHAEQSAEIPSLRPESWPARRECMAEITSASSRKAILLLCLLTSFPDDVALSGHLLFVTQTLLIFHW